MARSSVITAGSHVHDIVWLGKARMVYERHAMRLKNGIKKLRNTEASGIEKPRNTEASGIEKALNCILSVYKPMIFIFYFLFLFFKLVFILNF
jgi:hypothetical protein